MLQARAISARRRRRRRPSTRREQVRHEKWPPRAAPEPDGTVWSRFNLSEILPDPTPMTWAIVRRFMSVNGGFGLMYQDLGFDPDLTLGDEGVFDLVCGRPYYNLSREPRMLYHQLPFEHPFAALKAAPHKAIYPQPVLNPARGGFLFWLKLPIITFRMMRSSAQLRRWNDSFADKLRGEILPAFLKETSEEMAKDLTAVSTPALIERMEHWVRRTLYDFARDSLKPTALAGLAMGSLERALTKGLGPDRAKAALGELIMGVHPDPEADLPAAVRSLSEGKLERTEFLKRFGHRGSQEMELAHPRWAEEPWTVGTWPGPRTSSTPQGGLRALGINHGDFPVAAWPHRHGSEVGRGEDNAGKRPSVPRFSRRETGLHDVRLLYRAAWLNSIALRWKAASSPHAGRAAEAGGGRGSVGEDRGAAGRASGARHRVPQVIFSDDLDAGPAVSVADTLQGCPCPPASPRARRSCSATDGRRGADAAVRADLPAHGSGLGAAVHQRRALVMETGGVLSHGRIVAREFGLPRRRPATSTAGCRTATPAR